MNVSDEAAMEKRYEDQATDNGENYSSPPSYFYRGLIPGNSFGMGGSFGLEFIKDQRPLKMVTADGRVGLVGFRKRKRLPGLLTICVFPFEKIVPYSDSVSIWAFQ